MTALWDNLTASARPLTPAEFDNVFDLFWAKLRHRFFKLETLQQYNESGNPAYDAWMNNDQAIMLQELSRQVESQRSFYSGAETNGIQIVRVHLVDFPLSRYLLEYEFESYKFSAKAGETILLAERAKCQDLEDFMLFDDFGVLIPIFEDGKTSKAKLVDVKEAVTGFNRIADELLESAEPFDDFIKNRR